MLKFFLVAHLTYENQWVSLRNKIRTFGFFGTPYCRTYKLKVKKQSFHWIVGVVVLILIFLTCGNVFPLAKVHRLEFVEGGSLDFVVFRTDLIQ